MVTDLGPGLPQVRTSRAHLEQVVLGLAFQAHHALSAGCTLTIRTRNAEPREGRGAGGYVLLTVSAAGSGVAAEAAGPTGSGLGLGAIHGIVEAGGGRVEVESGAGRTWRVYLPGATDGG